MPPSPNTGEGGNPQDLNLIAPVVFYFTAAAGSACSAGIKTGITYKQSEGKLHNMLKNAIYSENTNLALTMAVKGLLAAYVLLSLAVFII